MFGLFKKPKGPEPDYATIYFADPSLLGSIFTFPGVQLYDFTKDESDTITAFKLGTEAGECIMNVMPPHMIEEHLAGMSAYAEQEVRDKARLPYVLDRIRQTRFVLGCVAPNGFGDEGEMIETLLKLNGTLNGLYFMGDSLFDHDAQPIAGSACDG